MFHADFQVFPRTPLHTQGAGDNWNRSCGLRADTERELDRFTIDRLMTVLNKLGKQVDVRIALRRQSAA